MIGILFPLLVTAIGVAYILSPIDIIPEVVLGPIGLADDIIVGIGIFMSWMIYFSAPLIEIIFNVILVSLVVAVLIYIATILYKKSKLGKPGRTKIKLRK